LQGCVMWSQAFEYPYPTREFVSKIWKLEDR
jgi:hypothetical protein